MDLLLAGSTDFSFTASRPFGDPGKIEEKPCQFCWQIVRLCFIFKWKYYSERKHLKEKTKERPSSFHRAAWEMVSGKGIGRLSFPSSSETDKASHTYIHTHFPKGELKKPTHFSNSVKNGTQGTKNTLQIEYLQAAKIKEFICNCKSTFLATGCVKNLIQVYLKPCFCFWHTPLRAGQNTLV